MTSEQGLLLPDLSRRLFVGELMDDPTCDDARLRRSHEQLALINRWLARARGLLRRFVLAHAARAPGRPAHLVDVGCGGGDLLLWLHRRARAMGLPLRLTGIDLDPRALRLARERLDDCPEVNIQHASAWDLAQLDPPADYVFCNHLLHHFDDAELPELLHRMYQAAGRRLLVSDLLRSRFAYLGYTALAGLLFHRSFTFHDGRLSIRKGFRPAELAAAAEAASIPQAHIATLAPGRIYLVADAAAASSDATPRRAGR